MIDIPSSITQTYTDGTRDIGANQRGTAAIDVTKSVAAWTRRWLMSAYAAA